MKVINLDLIVLINLNLFVNKLYYFSNLININIKKSNTKYQTILTKGITL